MPRAWSSAPEAVIGASNAFGFGLLRELDRTRADSNIFMSPLSASMALGMTMNGAAGATLDSMRAVLGFAGMPVADICRKAGISQATYFNWKKKYDGLLPDEMRRLKQLEDENGKLKKLVADLSLDREMLQDVIRRKL